MLFVGVAGLATILLEAATFDDLLDESFSNIKVSKKSVRAMMTRSPILMFYFILNIILIVN